MYHFTQTHFLITVHWNVSITFLQKHAKVFECCSFAMHGSRKRFTARSSTDQDLDFCTLLTVLESCAVKVCSFRNCISWMCSHSSHLDTRLAPWIICGMSSSLVRDLLVSCHFSCCVFSHVLMLTSLDVSQFTSRIFQTRVAGRLPTVHLHLFAPI